jgi:drug/metabolite transporter (DMT)-like permease
VCRNPAEVLVFLKNLCNFVAVELIRRLKYHLVAFIVVAIWGSTFVFTKMLLLAGLSPAQIFTLRFIIAYVLLLAWSLTRQHRWFCDSWRDELLMVALGVTGGSLYFLTENSSMNYTTTTNTSLIVSLSPLVATFLISLFYQSQRLNRVQSVGTLMAALGVVIVVLNGHFVLHLSPLGDSLAFGAALCWGLYSLLMIPANQKYDTVFITRKVFIYGLLSMIPYYILRPEEASIFSTSILKLFNLSILLNLLFLGCVASMLCFLAWNWVLKKLGAVIATNYVYFNPVTTILFAWWLLHEQITLWFLLGTVLILVGMYLADRK